MTRLGRKGEARRVLIVCPASLKHQWQREITRFTGLTGDGVVVVGGAMEALPFFTPSVHVGAAQVPPVH
jgi:hypothetical protein